MACPRTDSALLCREPRASEPLYATGGSLPPDLFCLAYTAAPPVRSRLLYPHSERSGPFVVHTRTHTHSHTAKYGPCRRRRFTRVVSVPFGCSGNAA